jgi:hypothetical protein
MKRGILWGGLLAGIFDLTFAFVFYGMRGATPIRILHSMNTVVLPLSAFPRKLSFPPSVLIPGLLCHMLLVGLPIALAMRRAAASDLRP